MPRANVLLAGACVALFLLTGCAKDEPATVAEAPAPIVTPTATPSVVTDTPATQTAFLCGDLVPTVTFESSVMPELVPASPSQTKFVDALSRQEGTLYCVWEGAGSSFDLYVMRGGKERLNDWSVLGNDGAGQISAPGVEESALVCGDRGDPVGCNLNLVTNGYAARGYLGSTRTDLSNSAQVAFAHEIGSLVVGAITAQPAPPAWSPPAGSWPLLADCEAIFARGASRALGNESSLAFRASGVDSPAPPEAVDSIGGSTLCWWHNKETRLDGGVSHVALVVLAGGAWYWDDESAHAGTVEVIDVAGVDDAALTCTDRGCSLDGRIGNNAFSFSGLIDGSYSEPMTRDQLMDAAPAIVAGLPAAND